MSYREIDRDYEDDEETRMIREEVRGFAKEVLRPASRKIDAMDEDEYQDPSAPGWDVYRDTLKQMKELGFHRMAIPADLGGEYLNPQQTHVMMEELGWGSSGLGIAIGVDSFPALLAGLSMDEDLMDELLYPYLEDEEAEFHGCWGVTEPAHGSEYV